MKLNFSIKGKVLFLTIGALCLQALLFGFGLHWFEVVIDAPVVLLIVTCLLLAIISLFLVLRWFYAPIEKLITALETGVSSFKDQDFSITIHNTHNDELGKIVDAYNDMAKTLCEERMSLFQREMLLDTIIQNSPVSVVLTDQKGFVIYANSTAQQLFNHASRMEGIAFSELLASLPSELKEATLDHKEGLVNIMREHERVSYYLHCQTFYLNSREHHLYLYKNLTTELSRQESDLWKKAIRLISHELNNSLAPVSSLANSAKKIIASEKQFDNLPDIIDTISLRVKKLNDFLKEYAEFARLPAPKIEQSSLVEFIAGVLKLCPYQFEQEVPDKAIMMDATQLEQVLINLYKNAVESGATKDKIALTIHLEQAYLVLRVSDDGGGMNQNQLQQALLPFYTTKQEGSGLGLSLCNEILTAHKGFIRLQNNNNPGLDVSLVLPV